MKTVVVLVNRQNLHQEDCEMLGRGKRHVVV